MKTTEVPVYFGTMFGDEIGKGTLEETDGKTIIQIEINKSADNVADLVRNQLMGFTMVVRPGNPINWISDNPAYEESGINGR